MTTITRRRATARIAEVGIPAMDRPGLATALLFTAKPTDRALAGWKPVVPVSTNRTALREQCRDVSTFT